MALREWCEGSYGHVTISVGQQQQTAGYARPNVATGVRCPVCRREFPRARISYTDHGIPTRAQALIPRHHTTTAVVVGRTRTEAITHADGSVTIQAADPNY